MRVTNGNTTFTDPAAFASFLNDTLTIDFKKVGSVLNAQVNTNTMLDGLRSQLSHTQDALRNTKARLVEVENMVVAMRANQLLMESALEQAEASIGAMHALEFSAARHGFWPFFSLAALIGVWAGLGLGWVTHLG